MSMPAQPIPPVPKMTVAVARRAFRKGSVYMQMRDVLGTFFTNDLFADLYPTDGQPAYAPWRLALVSVMQFAENLTDRQAADAVRSRIDWKYALSLELSDEGFDFSILSEFRTRLLEHEAGERLLDLYKNAVISSEEYYPDKEDRERQIAFWEARTTDIEKKAIELERVMVAFSQVAQLWISGDSDERTQMA